MNPNDHDDLIACRASSGQHGYGERIALDIEDLAAGLFGRAGTRFAVRVEVLHPRGAERELGRLAGVLDIRNRRRPAFDTSTATVVIQAPTARDAVRQVHERIAAVDPEPFAGVGHGPIDIHVRRTGWAVLDDVADHGLSHWNWDEVEHECTQTPSRSPNRGCNTLAKSLRHCRICGYEWLPAPVRDLDELEVDEALEMLGLLLEISDDAERRAAFTQWRDNLVPTSRGDDE